MRKLLIFAIGIGTGVAVGAAVALLFTPASGKEMRSDARERYRQILEESAHAAAVRRAELEAELNELTTSS